MHSDTARRASLKSQLLFLGLRNFWLPTAAKIFQPLLFAKMPEPCVSRAGHVLEAGPNEHQKSFKKRKQCP